MIPDGDLPTINSIPLIQLLQSPFTIEQNTNPCYEVSRWLINDWCDNWGHSVSGCGAFESWKKWTFYCTYSRPCFLAAFGLVLKSKLILRPGERWCSRFSHDCGSCKGRGIRCHESIQIVLINANEGVGVDLHTALPLRRSQVLCSSFGCSKDQSSFDPGWYIPASSVLSWLRPRLEARSRFYPRKQHAWESVFNPDSNGYTFRDVERLSFALTLQCNAMDDLTVPTTMFKFSNRLKIVIANLLTCMYDVAPSPTLLFGDNHPKRPFKLLH